MKSVQDRILGAQPLLEARTPQKLLQSIRNQLLRANQAELLRTPQQAIFKWVNLEPGNEKGEHVIVGGIKDFKRLPISKRFERDDGAWLHFSLTLHWDGRDALYLLAYDFELVFPAGHVPPFVRLDLNEPGHANQGRGLRSHVHPGNDDLQLPAPIMTPAEILSLFLEGLRPRAPEKIRA